MGVVAVTPQSLGMHKAGRIRILAVTSSKPLLAAPELPTVAQAGFPQVANEGTYGFLAPAGTPKRIIEQISLATRSLLKTPDYQQMLIEMGFEGTPDSSPEQFRKVLADAVAFWEPLVRSLNIKID
jgi:tripartite-type tricarboxylate transporter receptor subunit TctC